jgi:DUF917 family protein
MMTSYNDGFADFESIAAGAVTVKPDDGATNSDVVATMGSPAAGDQLTLAEIQNSAGSLWVVDGDGAGRAVPALPQTTFAGGAHLPVGRCARATDVAGYSTVESALLSAPTAAQVEKLTGRNASVAVGNFYITSVTQATTAASLDAGVIRLDNTQDPAESTQTLSIHNMNENLIMYSSQSAAPVIIAPDSICCRSESTGLRFSKASDDLAAYFDASTGKSTGKVVSSIQPSTAPQLYARPGMLASFAGLLRSIGHAGAMPSY